jgi:hypothetical protein
MVEGEEMERNFQNRSEATNCSERCIRKSNFCSTTFTSSERKRKEEDKRFTLSKNPLLMIKFMQLQEQVQLTELSSICEIKKVKALPEELAENEFNL